MDSRPPPSLVLSFIMQTYLDYLYTHKEKFGQYVVAKFMRTTLTAAIVKELNDFTDTLDKGEEASLQLRSMAAVSVVVMDEYTGLTNCKPDHARVGTKAFKRSASDRSVVDIVYPDIDSDGPEERIFRLQGFVVETNLPPVNRSLK